MDAQLLAAFGALFTGLGSLITALVSSMRQRKKDGDECERRIKELREVFYAGIRFKDKNFPTESR
jgi:hypothetical protein